MMKMFNRLGRKASLALVASLATSSAFAADELSAAVIGELTSGKAEILAVGGAILILVGVVALIRHIRSAAR